MGVLRDIVVVDTTQILNL